jgi:hypothetical protein
MSLTNVQIPSESTKNIETIRNIESVRVLCYHILVDGLCIKLSPIGTHPRVVA